MSDEIEAGISPAENFGSKVQALVILLSPFVVIAVLFAEHARSAHKLESTVGVMALWAPGYLVYMVFAGMRYFRPESMPPVLESHSKHILKMKQLRKWGFVAAAVCLVLFAVLIFTCACHWYIDALPILSCILLSAAILLNTYIGLRVPARRMGYVPGPQRRKTLFVAAGIALCSGASTVYLWGSFLAVMTVIVFTFSTSYFISLLAQRPWVRPADPGPDEESGSMPVLR